MLALGLAGLALVGCASAPEGVPTLDRPGLRALSSDDPSCGSDADCPPGEQCAAGVCQIQRCGAGSYASTSPLKKRSFVAVDRELVVAAGRSVIGYEPSSGSFARLSEPGIDAGGTVIDTVGGSFDGKGAEAVAVAIASATSVAVFANGSRTDVPVGFVPVAIASGDVEGDGIDELVALAADGALAVCNVAKRTCTQRSTGVTGVDLAMGDVDGDGHDEPVVLGKRGSSEGVIVVIDGDGTSDVELDTGHAAQRIAVGNVDGAGAPEVVTLSDGGYLGFGTDTLRVYRQEGGGLKLAGESGLGSNAADVAVGDLDGDDRVDLLVLRDDGRVEVFDPSDPAHPTSTFAARLDASGPTRLALVDLDGDSPTATLEGDAQLVPGPVVPIAVLVYPPYSRQKSDGTGQVILGSSESKGETQASTVTLNVGAAIGFEAKFPIGIKTSVTASVDLAMASTTSKGRTVTVGERFSVDAKPETEGPDSAVTVLACACYHAYTYAVDDPKGRLGERVTGKKMSLFVPVGGQTALWSLKRYNVVAKKLGGLPEISVPYAVGDPSSYPKVPTTLAGAAIPAKDMLFTTPKAYRTSDVARVMWNLSLAETEGRTEARTIGVRVRGQVEAGPVEIEGSIGRSTGEAYTISAGSEASFGGGVPPVRNDPRTPEDESELFGYGFSPIVYREHYETVNGNQGGYYVVTYTVAK